MTDYHRLKVSDNRRFLVDQDDQPFFYLGDTAWELFHRCNREEADLYLENRAAKKFTVIQAVVLAELDGLNTPNAYGHSPLVGNDPEQPNEDYFKQVDYVVDKVHSLGIFIGMLPTWGDKYNRRGGKGPEVFTPSNARIYGRFLGERYGGKNIIWITGGDRSLDSDEHLEIIRAMAEGIREGDQGRNLITFHPPGGRSSATFVHAEDWLDFHMIQSGHHRYCPTHEFIERDYQLKPTRPTLDGEPGYEDHPNRFNTYHGWLDEYDVRRSCYWSLFAGGCGYTYGCHDIWQMYQEGRDPISWARTSWKQALDFPGSSQVQHARTLLESRPYLTRVPDQSMIVGSSFNGENHIRATRCSEGSYILIYVPAAQRVDVDLRSLKSERAEASWYNPRTGEHAAKMEVECTEKQTFQPPYDPAGRDWVLVLDAK